MDIFRAIQPVVSSYVSTYTQIIQQDRQDGSTHNNDASDIPIQQTDILDLESNEIGNFPDTISESDDEDVTTNEKCLCSILKPSKDWSLELVFKPPTFDDHDLSVDPFIELVREMSYLTLPDCSSDFECPHPDEEFQHLFGLVIDQFVPPKDSEPGI